MHLGHILLQKKTKMISEYDKKTKKKKYLITLPSRIHLQTTHLHILFGDCIECIGTINASPLFIILEHFSLYVWRKMDIKSY